MRKNNCGVVRQELDELMLDEACSTSAAAHLRECAGCREFHQQQTKLRQIVGSLGTVSAPPDFDFRLRARLANDPSSAALAYWPFARRGFALATVLLVFVTGAVLLQNVLNRPETGEGVVSTNKPAAVPEPPKPVETNKAAQDNSGQQLVATNPEKRAQPVVKNDRPSSTAPRTPRRLVAQDFSGQRAEVISGQEAVSDFQAFSLDASLESFKLSLDDGRGNARTISVPTISFGSQRMLQTGNQFAPKRVW